MADVSADEFLLLQSVLQSATKRFLIDKFRKTQQDAILNLLKGKDVLVSQPTASGKFEIFRSILIIVDVA